MAVSVVDVYNLALGRIGTDKSVSAVNENSKEARLCNRFYAQCRDEVLEAAAWPFAVKREPLASLTGVGILSGWAYEYAKPVTALRMLEVAPASEVGAALTHWCGCCGPWDANLRTGASAFRTALAQDNNSVSILSNVSGAYGVFVSRVENPAAWSALFTSCVADRLAMEIAMPMSADARYLNMAMTRYNTSFMLAAGSDYEQSQEPPDSTPPSILARN